MTPRSILAAGQGSDSHSRRTLRRIAILSAAISLAHVAPAMAQLYWDINDNGAGAGGATPSGSWDGTTPNWNSSSDGSSSSAGTWVPDNTAVFSAGSDATGAFTITVVGTQSAGGVQVQSGSPTIMGDEFDLSGGASVQVNDGLTGAFNNVIGGGSGFNKSGNGTIVLGNSGNTFSGDMNINGGVVNIAADGALGNSGNNLNFNSGTLALSGNVTTARTVNLNGDGTIDTGASNNGTFSGAIHAAGALNKIGGGSVTLSGIGSDFTGQLNILNGVVVTTASNGLGSNGGSTVVSSGAALVINNNISISEPFQISGTGINNTGAIRKINNSGVTLSGGVTLNAAARINCDTNTLTINTTPITGADTNLTLGGNGNISIASGMISIGTGTLIKDGTGTLVLTNSDTMAGVKISAGTATIPNVSGGPTALGTLPTIGVGVAGYASANIVLDGGTLFCTATSAAGSYIQAARGITLTSKGGKVGVNDSSDHHQNQNVVYNGLISLDPSTTTATLFKVGTGEFRAGPVATSPFQNTKLEIDSGTYRVSTGTGSPATGDGAFGKVPATYDASAILANGTGVARGSGGVCIALSANVTTPASRGVTLGTNGLTVETNASWTVQSIITGPGALSLNENGFTTSAITSANSLILTGSNTYQGATNVYDGIMNVQGESAIPDASAVFIAPATTVSVVDNTGAVLGTQNNKAILQVTNSETIGSLAGGAPGYGSVSFSSGQTLTTGGNNTSTQFDGIIAGGGSLTKAGTGTFTVTAANTYTGQTTVTGGALKVNIAAAAPLTANTNGTDIQGGRVIFDWTGGSTPAGTIVPMLQAGYPSNFTSTANKIHSSTGNATKGLGFKDDSTAHQFTVAYTYYGDADLSGAVDTSDFATLSLNFGKTSQTWVNGDFNYDGTVNALDFNALATNFGAPQLSAPPVLGTLVPEPGSLALLAVPALALRRHRRRRA